MTVIGENCKIMQNTRICDSVIKDNVEVQSSVITESTVGAGTKVGPFAYLRPESVIGENCKVGDFVEVKNSSIGDGSKASHLTYIGDSDVGRDVNIGCGVVFVNYDGTKNTVRLLGMEYLSVAIPIWYLRSELTTAHILRQEAL